MRSSFPLHASSSAKLLPRDSFYSIIMVVSPHGHKTDIFPEKKTYRSAFQGGHKRSQRVTTGHKIAPGHSASDFWWSQRDTKSHQTTARAISAGHLKSQNRSRPQREGFLVVTKGHKIAPGTRARSAYKCFSNKSHPNCASASAELLCCFCRL